MNEALAPLLGWLALGSLVLLVAAAVGLPLVLRRMPADHFLHPPPSHPRRPPVVHAALVVLRNLTGLVLIVAGVLMLVLPGQGILTILAGVLLTDLPGKRRLELAFLRRPAIRKAVDWLRQRGGEPPLRLPDDPA